MKLCAPVVVIGVSLLAGGRSAHAACGVRVLSAVGATDASWRSEAVDLQSRLQNEWGKRDCKNVELRVERNGTGAWMAFAESGGTVARRHLASARELEPAVRALLVRVDADYFAGEAPAVVEPDVVSRPREPSPPLAYAFGLSAGIRVGIGDGALVRTPVLAGSVSFIGMGWELGVTGQWESRYSQAVIDQEPDWRASALAIGIIVGRRVPVDTWDVAAGLSVSAAVVHGMSDDELPHTVGSGADARAGAYVGLVGSRTAHFRFRMTLGADFVPARAGASNFTTAPANLPWWMGTFSIGVEAAP